MVGAFSQCDLTIALSLSLPLAGRAIHLYTQFLTTQTRVYNWKYQPSYSAFKAPPPPAAPS